MPTALGVDRDTSHGQRLGSAGIQLSITTRAQSMTARTTDLLSFAGTFGVPANRRNVAWDDVQVGQGCTVSTVSVELYVR